VRASGTEPILRVYAETSSDAATRAILEETCAIVRGCKQLKFPQPVLLLFRRHRAGHLAQGARDRIEHAIHTTVRPRLPKIAWPASMGFIENHLWRRPKCGVTIHTSRGARSRRAITDMRPTRQLSEWLSNQRIQALGFPPRFPRTIDWRIRAWPVPSAATFQNAASRRAGSCRPISDWNSICNANSRDLLRRDILGVPLSPA